MPPCLRRLLSLCTLWAALAAPASAQQLILAFDELPPWLTTDGGKYGGAYVEIARELARRVGLPLHVVKCPLKRCLQMLAEGSADLAIGFKDSEARRTYMHFLATPYRSRSSDRVFYIAKGKNIAIGNYEDLAGLRIGVKLGAAYFDRFDRDGALNKAAVPDSAVNFRKLLLGRLDTVLAPEDQGEAMINKLGIRASVEKAAFRPPDPTPRTMGISKKSVHAARLKHFDQAMSAMANDGTLARIYRQHYHDAYNIPADAVQIR
ncbi:MAG: transporter substrate-binding domain-containing protein [Pseudomonadota bacterium]